MWNNAGGVQWVFGIKRTELPRDGLALETGIRVKLIRPVGHKFIKKEESEVLN
jgi:hypothetical protein